MFAIIKMNSEVLITKLHDSGAIVFHDRWKWVLSAVNLQRTVVEIHSSLCNDAVCHRYPNLMLACTCIKTVLIITCSSHENNCCTNNRCYFYSHGQLLSPTAVASLFHLR